MELQNRCRTCLETTVTSSNIFEKKQNDKLISELIMECIPIVIRDDDKLPANMCDDCLHKLNSVWEFKEMVIKSDKTLSEEVIDDISDETDKNVKAEMVIKEEGDQDLYVKSESVEQITVESCLNLSVSDNGEDEDSVAESVLTDEENTVSSVSDNGEDEDSVAESVLTDEENTVSLKEEGPNTSKIKTNSKKNQINNKKGAITTTCLSEEQLEILDNPDCKRLMESGLSSRAKAREQVYCQVCNKSYTYKYYITVHAHTHIGNLPFKCDFCDFRVPKKHLLHQHMRKHAPVTKDFLCSICGRAFSTKQKLNSHRVRHTDERPFKCKICGKAFKQPLDVQQHEAGHEDTKRFVCDECGKSFKHKKTLSDHKIGHTNQRNFECTTCGKRFMLKKCLDLHMKKHLGLKPYSCDICGKKFTVKMTWRNHLWIHTGEKPYACEICGKNFRQRACITRHMRIHTGEAPYACKYCPEKFKYSQQLQNHVMKHEKNNAEFDVKHEIRNAERDFSD
ncbi:Zinc-finger associated domain (zf-AD) [Popillia japonica]|uniref:Zinc-finger associated domain (Zf-AD) n=1 Tax=Popillia japonica TaxID=7064 RepID=A0AAW1KN40_POPJA